MILDFSGLVVARQHACARPSFTVVVRVLHVEVLDAIRTLVVLDLGADGDAGQDQFADINTRPLGESDALERVAELLVNDKAASEVGGGERCGSDHCCSC